MRTFIVTRSEDRFNDLKRFLLSQGQSNDQTWNSVEKFIEEFKSLNLTRKKEQIQISQGALITLAEMFFGDFSSPEKIPELVFVDSELRLNLDWIDFHSIVRYVFKTLIGGFPRQFRYIHLMQKDVLGQQTSLERTILWLEGINIRDIEKRFKDAMFADPKNPSRARSEHSEGFGRYPRHHFRY